MDNVIIYDAIDGVLNECETVMGGGEQHTGNPRRIESYQR